MHIHQKARVALSGIGGQIGGGQSMALPQFDGRMGDAVDLADLAEAVTEAAAGHHQQPVVLGEHVLRDGIHGGRAGAGEEYRSGILRGIHELLEQRLVLLHQSGEVRRAEIGHGVCADPGNLLRDLNRTHRKVDMILFDVHKTIFSFHRYLSQSTLCRRRLIFRFQHQRTQHHKQLQLWGHALPPFTLWMEKRSMMSASDTLIM